MPIDPSADPKADPQAKPERQQTDESLRIERDKTDRALAKSQATAEGEADLVVLQAREHADAILSEAREKADGLSAETSRIAGERRVEDDVLKDERAAADALIERAREDIVVLSKLLPLERERTDRYLLTERIRSDAALAHRDDFLGIVSHDLRNLLGGIVMSTSLLDTVHAVDAEAQKQMKAETARIQRYAARMNRLIGDLVDVASIDAGKLSVTPSMLDASALVAEAVDMFRASASAKEITLTTDMAPGLSARFDHDRLLQVLANLITNAIKFTPKGGTIAVHGTVTDDAMELSVTDDGPGIPPNMLVAVFERFWQVTKADSRGLGLGLYISKCIVTAHGGTIWVKSNLGGGSCFAFKIPLVEVEVEAAAAAPTT